MPTISAEAGTQKAGSASIKNNWFPYGQNTRRSDLMEFRPSKRRDLKLLPNGG
jgi:hypothetical protein